MKRLTIFIVFLTIASSLPAQENAGQCDYTDSPVSLNLTIDNTGISFGNSRVTHGLRINLRDECVREVNGINLTLWKPGRNPDAVFRGISVGLYGPWADEIDFLALGGVHVQANSALNGLAVAGLVNVSGGEINGIALSGLANVAGDDFSGIALAGLANVSGGGFTGIEVGGLANVSDGPTTGISLGGLANVSDGDMSGISLGGLANVSDGDCRGISLGGLANVSDGDMNGIALGGLANVNDGRTTGNPEPDRHHHMVRNHRR